MSMQQYLDRHAEPEVNCLEAFQGHYDHVLCIPAFAENPDCLDTVLSEINPSAVLVILVVNAPENAAETQQLQTRAIAQHLKQQAHERKPLLATMVLLAGNGSPDILLVERCSPGNFIEEKAGVGKARKIACDIACRLIAMGCIDTPWIHTTDADARLPAGYFSAATGLDEDRDSAGIYPFRHIPSGNDALDTAQQLYDASLHYYVAGLRWAGSPWAYHTIGSTLVINAQQYASARGFPKRQAGEDFYLLNKLAKMGRIVSLDTAPVKLESRLSGRVPFGTGPALKKILVIENPVVNYLFYAPVCFVYLRFWLQLSRSLWTSNRMKISTADIGIAKESSEEYDDIDSDLLLACLAALGVEKALDHAFSHSKSETVFLRHLDNWFDSFLTLKFIHWLRDNHFPSLPSAEILEKKALPFTAPLKGL